MKGDVRTIESIVSEVRKGIPAGDDALLLGNMFPLAKECGATTEDEVFAWMQKLGDAIAETGFVLTSGPRGAHEELWVIPK